MTPHQCPNCGATQHPDADHCPWCRTVFFEVEFEEVSDPWFVSGWHPGVVAALGLALFLGAPARPEGPLLVAEFDAPIVWPGDPSGKTHQHVFYGNSVTDTILYYKVDGAVSNRTGYWAPVSEHLLPPGKVYVEKPLDKTNVVN